MTDEKHIVLIYLSFFCLPSLVFCFWINIAGEHEDWTVQEQKGRKRRRGCRIRKTKLRRNKKSSLPVICAMRDDYNVKSVKYRTILPL